MKKKIENPKIFISYAWGDDEYQNQVLAFASQLVSDGIDVILDKWALSEGNDTYAFMEQCVNDTTITNVLMLLDPLYAQKADDHSGGVGTETQIISSNVYQKVTQDKFIPVVMARDAAGNVCKPIYLQGRLHFDLSIPENYDMTYQRLVKTLFGEEIYAKPELGQKPNWVEKQISISPKTILAYDSLKVTQPSKVKEDAFTTFLNEISDLLIEYANKDSANNLNKDEYIALYDGTEFIKNNYLQLIKNTSYVENGPNKIASFFEETKNLLVPYGNVSNEVVQIRIHELFLYTVAHFMKSKDYTAVGYLLGKTYFNQQKNRDNCGAESFNMFYSGTKHSNLDNAINARDNKHYHTGVGHHWIETLSNDFCSKEQFVLADLICFNYSIYGKDYIDTGWCWFPITYIYDNKYTSILDKIGRKMISREFTQELLPLFGYDTIEKFVAKVNSVEETETLNQAGHKYRYPDVFESAPTLGCFIKAEKIAILR